MPKKVIGGKVEKRIPVDGIGGVFLYANDAKALSNWYAHHFSVSGGQELTLPALHPTNSYYGVAVSYKTFFQECLERIR